MQIEKQKLSISFLFGEHVTTYYQLYVDRTMKWFPIINLQPWWVD